MKKVFKSKQRIRIMESSLKFLFKIQKKQSFRTFFISIVYLMMWTDDTMEIFLRVQSYLFKRHILTIFVRVFRN